MNKGDIQTYSSLDWKATGYLTSIVSVFFLGAVAWKQTDPPDWYYPALIVGVTTSVLGMGFRYLSHIRQKKEMANKADRRKPADAR